MHSSVRKRKNYLLTLPTHGNVRQSQVTTPSIPHSFLSLSRDSLQVSICYSWVESGTPIPKHNTNYRPGLQPRLKKRLNSALTQDNYSVCVRLSFGRNKRKSDYKAVALTTTTLICWSVAHSHKTGLSLLLPQTNAFGHSNWQSPSLITTNQMFELFAGNWSKIARAMGNRTDNQCWRRWIVIWQSPSLITTNQMFELFAGNWSKIARAMGNRTDNQCWRRWIVICKDDVSYFLSLPS